MKSATAVSAMAQTSDHCTSRMCRDLSVSRVVETPEEGGDLPALAIVNRCSFRALQKTQQFRECTSRMCRDLSVSRVVDTPEEGGDLPALAIVNRCSFRAL